MLFKPKQMEWPLNFSLWDSYENEGSPYLQESNGAGFRVRYWVIDSNIWWQTVKVV